MPESSLAEEAAIPPAGNVLAARIPAGHTSGINVTGIPGRRQPSAWGTTTDANGCVGDDPVFSARPGLYPFTEWPVERDRPAPIRNGRPIFPCPAGRATHRRAAPGRPRQFSNVSPPRQQAPFPEG
jgi:hypothetical protein